MFHGGGLFRFLRNLILLAVVLAAAVNGWVWYVTRGHILPAEQPVFGASQTAQADCILVLGAGVVNGSPSLLLKNRLDTAIALYRAGAAPKLLMSGDHADDSYNEVRVMLEYALAAGVPAKDIFLDHAGFSTYESLYRAKFVYGAESIIIVSQKYHLYRALYLADVLGLEASGAAAEDKLDSARLWREAREIAARVKDFVNGILLPEIPGCDERIPLDGDGTVTHTR